jgi:hypothetical protein
MRYIALTVAAVFLFSHTVFAATAINQAGADKLKPQLLETLKNLEVQLKAQGYTLKQEGPLLIEPAGNYYAITTSALSLTFGANISRNIGMVAINAIPTDDPDIFKVAIAIPTPITDTTADGKQTGIITLGTQNMNGLWHLKANTFIQLAATYKDIQYKNIAENKTFTLPELAATIKLSKNDQNLWSGPTTIDIKNPSYTSPISNVTIQKISMLILIFLRGNMLKKK